MPAKLLHIFLCRYGRNIEELDLKEMIRSLGDDDRALLYKMIPLYCPNLRELDVREGDEDAILDQVGKNLSLMGT